MEPERLKVLVYDYVEDVLERRGPYREAHLDAARAARDAGRLRMAGAVGDPPTGGWLVFGPDVPDEEIEAFADADPYVVNGIVTGRRIVPWTVVV